MFACRREDVDHHMMNDSLCELVNMPAGLVKSAMSLDQALGLPKILAASDGPPPPPTGPHAIVLKADAVGLVRDVTVAILSDGRAVVGGKVLDEAALRQAFTGARARNADTVVLFQADEGVPHGRVVQVMELARQAGLSRLAIATRTEAGAAP
jgi:hypothetical protein